MLCPDSVTLSANLAFAQQRCCATYRFLGRTCNLPRLCPERHKGDLCRFAQKRLARIGNKACPSVSINPLAALPRSDGGLRIAALSLAKTGPSFPAARRCPEIANHALLRSSSKMVPAMVFPSSKAPVSQLRRGVQTSPIPFSSDGRVQAVLSVGNVANPKCVWWLKPNS